MSAECPICASEVCWTWSSALQVVQTLRSLASSTTASACPVPREITRSSSNATADVAPEANRAGVDMENGSTKEGAPRINRTKRTTIGIGSPVSSFG